ncbi:GGDEF domain-containing protein [Nitrincola tapanii]|uniref:diguanylate cyclase n=1 Tax=Nitrincola tapanii TaxID=1708751 RepID=A0A5A9VYZ2_9GAMM|nr:diguanylate cyclase [Nitrincola tapanii]KAA0873613.1 sensor domain-containing diguanylate cyclase [Nitrincola tapanii]
MEYFSRSLVLILLYFVFWHFASLFALTPLVSAFYPAAGVILFFIYRYGAAYIPAAALAILLGSLPIDTFWYWEATQISMSLRQLAIYSLCGLFLRRVSNFNLPILRLRDVGILLLSTLIATLISAAIALFLLRHFANLPTAVMQETFLSFWIGDLAGVLMFMAAASLFVDFYDEKKSYDDDVFDNGFARPILLLCLLVFVTSVFFVLTGLEDDVSRFGYLILLPVAWAAGFYGMRFALLAAISVNFSAVGTYILMELSSYPALELQTLFTVTLAMAMLLGASLEERKLALFDAAHDPLTQMLNRRAFFQQAKELLERCKRQQRDLALLMIDLDHFKRINDTFGHHAGDQVLMKVAECCRKVCRQTDIQGRLGGEEFVLLLDDATPEQAMIVAERLRLSIEEVMIPMSREHITTSIGLSHLMMPEDDIEHLLKEADRALYEAKSKGRNNCQSSLPHLIPAFS